MEYGPLLLSSVAEPGAFSERIADLSHVIPDASHSLNFVTKGEHPNRFVPYMMIREEQQFTNYPVDVTIDTEFALEKHISAPGFSVEFFDNQQWEGEPVYKGTVSSINYPNESKIAIAPKVPVENFSSRFEGEFISPKTGAIAFIISTDDGYSFSINGKEVSKSNSHTNRGDAFFIFKVVKGEKYALKLTHVQGIIDYRIILKANFINENH
jgi:hypothetical protein